jgi:4-amino-4-deoxy-L-arabinose transferase-like glycosyltransferase
MSPTRPIRPICLFLLALAAALCLAGIVDHDLWNPDEPRVCSIAKAMWQTRDWAVPRLAGEIFIEKPPLYLWLCGACGHLFEPLFGYVGAARLSVSLCALATLAATAWLAFLLRGRRRDALFGVLVLATMPQFLIDMHRMRVDVLLASCVAVSVAFLAHAYLKDRPWSLLPAGIAAAGAFLSKGPVGWILILPAAIPLAFHAFLSERGRPARKTWFFAHLLAAGLALGLSALWVLAIYRHPDPGAWKAWFWENQIGRTTGTATALGHHHPWELHYYLVHLPAVFGPWIPHFLLWLAGDVKTLRAAPLRDRWRSLLLSPAFFLACWGFGGLILLTLPSTKRGIYLLPLYPAYALMAADAIPRATHVLFKYWSRIAQAGALLFAAGILLIPALAPLLPESLPAPLVRWTPYHTATLLLALLCLAAFRLSKTARPATALFLANAFLWLVIFAVPYQARDTRKSMRAATLRMAAALPADTSRTAAYRLDETARALLHFYAGVVLVPLDVSHVPPHLPGGELATSAVSLVLSGKHPRFNAILAEAHHVRDRHWPHSAEAARSSLPGNGTLYYLAPRHPGNRFAPHRISALFGPQPPESR